MISILIKNKRDDHFGHNRAGLVCSTNAKIWTCYIRHVSIVRADARQILCVIGSRSSYWIHNAESQRKQVVIRVFLTYRLTNAENSDILLFVYCTVGLQGYSDSLRDCSVPKSDCSFSSV